MAKSTKVADKLLSMKVIDPNGHRQALRHFMDRGGFIEESLIDAKVIEEETLLRTLANLYHTQYVTTEKLRRAEIPQSTLKIIDAAMALKYTVFPVLYDPGASTLSLVCVNSSDVLLEQEIARFCNLKRVRLLLARPSAITACIAKYYSGDLNAFASLDEESYNTFNVMMESYGRNMLDESTFDKKGIDEGSRVERIISPAEMEESSASVLPNHPTKSNVTRISKMPPPAPVSGIREEDHLKKICDMLRVMVSLIESSRGDLAGHSVQTAHFTERLCKRMGLPEKETNAITIAALLHDLGKGSPYHLTAFNVAEWDGHRTAAQKRFENPLRLFESVVLLPSTTQSLRSMYERFNGAGIPQGLTSKDIPLGARILGLTDTFADLTSNPRNPFRHALSIDEAMKVLIKAKNQVFDPNLVDMFGMVVAGDDLKRRLTGAQTLLLVEPDHEQSAILDLQLTTRGYKVRTARNVDQAQKILADESINLIISESELEPVNGFEFKKRLNKNEKTSSIPFVFFTTRSASADVEKGFQIGAKDYIVKPSTVDILVAKLQNYLIQKTQKAANGNNSGAGGVSGSLSDMSLPDLVQILSHGRKNGRLQLDIDKKQGELHFVTGDIYCAIYGDLRGEDAFFEMLKHREGSFSLDPNFTAEDREINMTAEMLLLEGMRRVDEDNR